MKMTKANRVLIAAYKELQYSKKFSHSGGPHNPPVGSIAVDDQMGDSLRPVARALIGQGLLRQVHWAMHEAARKRRGLRQFLWVQLTAEGLAAAEALFAATQAEQTPASV